MKFPGASLCLGLCAVVFLAKNMQAGEVETREVQTTIFGSDGFAVPHLEVAAESAYLCSIAGNPNSYEIGAEFITARLRWGVNRDDASWFRGYNQVYLLAMAEPIFRGPENRYFGLSAGFRH